MLLNITHFHLSHLLFFYSLVALRIRESFLVLDCFQYPVSFSRTVSRFSAPVKRSMDRNQMQRQVALMRSSLFEQRYLDQQQFVQLEDLQDDANPNFVEEIVTLFYKDSTRLFQKIEQTMLSRPIDFAKLDDYMHQFKGSSSSIGAIKVKNECSQFKEFCLAGNAEGCFRAFQKVKQEHQTLRIQLETYFQLRRQAGLVQHG